MRISQQSPLALAETFLIGYTSNNIDYNIKISVIGYWAAVFGEV
jgi:hypothetical protein